MVLSTGEEFDSELIVWAAGNAANPVVAQQHGPPGRRARVPAWCGADLRVGTADAPVADAWAAGDDAAVPDLAVGPPGGAPCRTPSTPCARAGTSP